MADEKKQSDQEPERTDRIGPEDENLSETMDVNLEETGRLEAEAAPEKTTPVAGGEETAGVETGDATGRIETAGVETGEMTGRVETGDVDTGDVTGRIETGEMAGEETADLGDDLEAAMAATMAVALDDDTKPSETSRIETDELGKPGDTSRIAAGMMGATMAVDLDDDAKKGGTEAPKAETARIDAPDTESTPTRPRTVKLKRAPVTAAPTRVLKKMPSAPSGEDKKGATSKLDLPDTGGGARPVTRPKTIRIRRPESAAARGQQISVARPSGTAAPTVSPAGVPAAAMVGAEAPGAGYAVMAFLAMVASLVLVYALLYQSYLPDLPVPSLF